MPQISQNLIDTFLAQKRFALIGASRKPKSYSRQIFLEFSKRGYEVVPVNPYTVDLDGVLCFPDTKSITPKVDAALIVTDPDRTDQIVQDCANAGIRLLWIRGKDGKSSLSTAAVQTCKEHGITVIDGYCPLMFLPNSAVFHRFHGFILKLAGKYPQKS